MKPRWDAYLNVADDLTGRIPPAKAPPQASEVSKLGKALPILSLAYLGTKNAAYLNGARRWMEALVGYPSWATNDDLAASTLCLALAASYDWLYPLWTPGERARIEAKLAKHARLLYAYSRKTTGRFWSSSWWQNHCWINHTAIAVSAIALLDVLPEEARHWLDYTRDKFENTYRYFGVDGSNYEGITYSTYGTRWMLVYLEALRAISGESLYDMPYLHRFVRFRLYTLMPDRRQVAGFGDTDPEYPVPAHLFYRLASEYRDGYAAWLAEETLRADPKSAVPTTPFDILWYDPSVTPRSPETLPTTGFFPDLGLALFRSGWDREASVVMFKCGPPGGTTAMLAAPSLREADPNFSHAHPDAGTFLFWAERKWLISDPAGYNFDKRTHHENVWIVDGKGQRGERKWFDGKSYLGRTPQAAIRALAVSSRADYIVGEAAPAYESAAEVTRVRRHLLFVKRPQPYLIVFDQVAARKAATWRMHLHSRTPLQGTGTGFRSEPPGTLCGYLFASKGLEVHSHPLRVAEHPTGDIVERGFEAEIGLTERTASAWLITVLSPRPLSVTLIRPAPLPDLTVGQDRIVWNTEETVMLNGHALHKVATALTSGAAP